MSAGTEDVDSISLDSPYEISVFAEYVFEYNFGPPEYVPANTALDCMRVPNTEYVFEYT